MCYKCDELKDKEVSKREWFPIEDCLDYEREKENQKREYEDYDPQR